MAEKPAADERRRRRYLTGREVQGVDGHEAFFPDIYTQMYPDGSHPSIPPQGRDLGKIPIFKLSHGTHSPQTYEIEPHGDHSDHYIFKPNIKVGKKYDDRERTFKYIAERRNRFQLVPSDEALLPGKYSWWGVSVEDWYTSDDPDGREFGRQVRELKDQRIFVAEYLQTNIPECQYGDHVFTISLKNLLGCYDRSRTDVNDADKRTIKLDFAGTLRYRYEICYVVVVSMKHDYATLSELELCSVYADTSIFDHNGLVNADGEIVNDSATPYIRLKHKIKCIPKQQYQSWETLAFAFYYPSDSNDKLKCHKDLVTKLPSVRHKCHQQCKVSLMDDDSD